MMKRLAAASVRTFVLMSFACLPVAHAWKKGELLVWINNDKGYKGLQKVGDDFALKTGIKVKVETPENATDAFEAAMKSGSGPDVWIWPHDRIGDWIRKGFLIPVTPSADMQSQVVQIAWDGFTSQGKIWGYPIAVEAVSLVYNKDLVQQAPKSFEQIQAIQNTLKAKGIRAIGWETQSPYFTWPMLAANGAYPFVRDLQGNYLGKQTGINNPGAVKGAELLVQMIRDGLVEPAMSYAEAEKAMKAKKQAMWITGPWAWEGLQQAGVNIGIAPLPTVAGQPARPFVGVLGAMLTKGSPNKEAATQFIEKALLTSEGLKTVNADRPIGVPASKNLFWDFYGDPKVRAAMDGIYAGKAMPNNPEMQFFWSALSKALTDITSGNRKPAAALDEAAKSIVSAQ